MNQNTNNYLAEERIGKLLLKFSIPCIMSLLVSSLYNIVDQIFIGRGVGYLGNGATNVVFPITVISLAIALMLGDGAAAYLSLCQGKKDVKSGNKSMGNVVMLLVAFGVIMAVLFAVFKSQILTAFGATENNLPYANEYFDYIILGIPFFVVGNGLNSIIRADGSPKFAMITTLALLWFITGIVFELIGLPFLFLKQNSPGFVFMMLATVALVIVMMVVYLSISRKYEER